MPSKTLPQALKLRDLVGRTIELTDAPLKRVESKKEGYKPSYIAKTVDGKDVWLSQAVVDNFEGTHVGRYVVVAYTSSFGNTSYALRNAA